MGGVQTWAAPAPAPVTFRRPARWVTLAPFVFAALYGAMLLIVLLGHRPGSGSCRAEGCGDGYGSPVVLAVFTAAVAVFATVTALDAYRSQVTLTADALERRRLLRHARIPWDVIAGAALVEDRSTGMRPLPTVITREGTVITLRELRSPRFPPFSRPKPVPSNVELVEQINRRVGRSVPVPPPPPPATRPVMTLSRGFVTAALVILFVPFLVAFLALAAMGFTGFSASVDPAQVPPGRAFVGSTDRTGATHHWVECPPPIEAAHGGDPLCRSDAETSLRVAAIGAPICFVVLVLLMVAFVANRRRRRPGTPAPS